MIAAAAIGAIATSSFADAVPKAATVVACIVAVVVASAATPFT